MELEGVRHYISIFIFGISLIFIGCGENSNTTAPSERIIQEIISFTTNHTQAGFLKWSLEAKKAVFLENHKILITEPYVKIYENQKHSQNTDKVEDNSHKFIKITGDNGKVDDRTKDLEVLGNVKGVSDNGTLYTNKLIWNDKKGLIYAPNRVKITRGDSVMLGKNMIANPSLKIVNMETVNFTLYPKDEKINN